MTDYIYPTNTTRVSDSFADHVARGSVNPGTDYVVYRVPVYSVAAGVVTDADGNPSGSGGRMVHVDHDDGTGADYLHLDSLSVSRGDRVAQGQKIGVSGNSGDPVGGGVYGYHLHLSFRRRHGSAYTRTDSVDFDQLMRAQAELAAFTAQALREKEETMQLITIIADANPADEQRSDPKDAGVGLFASTAVISPAGKFIPTSHGRSDRSELIAWAAVANALGIEVTERHVDVNGYLLAQRF